MKPDDKIGGYRLRAPWHIIAGPRHVVIIARWADKPSTWLACRWYAWNVPERWAVTAYKTKRAALADA